MSKACLRELRSLPPYQWEATERSVLHPANSALMNMPSEVRRQGTQHLRFTLVLRQLGVLRAQASLQLLARKRARRGTRATHCALLVVHAQNNVAICLTRVATHMWAQRSAVPSYGAFCNTVTTLVTVDAAALR